MSKRKGGKATGATAEEKLAEVRGLAAFWLTEAEKATDASLKSNTRRAGFAAAMRCVVSALERAGIFERGEHEG